MQLVLDARVIHCLTVLLPKDLVDEIAGFLVYQVLSLEDLIAKLMPMQHHVAFVVLRDEDVEYNSSKWRKKKRNPRRIKSNETMKVQEDV